MFSCVLRQQCVKLLKGFGGTEMMHAWKSCPVTTGWTWWACLCLFSFSSTCVEALHTGHSSSRHCPHTHTHTPYKREVQLRRAENVSVSQQSHKASLTKRFSSFEDPVFCTKRNFKKICSWSNPLHCFEPSLRSQASPTLFYNRHSKSPLKEDRVPKCSPVLWHSETGPKGFMPSHVSQLMYLDRFR